MSLWLSGFVTSRGAAQSTEGEERSSKWAPALLAASPRSGSVPGCERELCPLWWDHHPTGHVWLPPPDVHRLSLHCQAPQRPAASDTGRDARGETGVAGLTASGWTAQFPQRHVSPAAGRHVPGIWRRTGSLWVGLQGAWGQNHERRADYWEALKRERDLRCRHCDRSVVKAFIKVKLLRSIDRYTEIMLD